MASITPMAGNVACPTNCRNAFPRDMVRLQTCLYGCGPQPKPVNLSLNQVKMCEDNCVRTNPMGGTMQQECINGCASQCQNSCIKEFPDMPDSCINACRESATN